MNKNPVGHPLWNEEIFQLLTRVIDAVIYEQKPGMKTILVAEYLARAARAEVADFWHRRRARKRHSFPSKRNQPRP